MKPVVQIAVLAACLCAASAGWLPEKLIKKYAMMKISEDCFGEEVMSSFRDEMYAAHVKCSGHHAEELPAADALLSGDEDVLSRRRRHAPRRFSREKLEKMRAKVTTFIGNATCVLREMKMLDEDNNVDVDSMKERLTSLEIDESLKKDMHESIDACHQFSSCLPDSVVSQPGVVMGFGRQMVFFKCFKESKIESCMKKTFREDYLPMLVEDSMPADENESFYTLLSAAIVAEKKVF